MSIPRGLTIDPNCGCDRADGERNRLNVCGLPGSPRVNTAPPDALALRHVCAAPRPPRLVGRAMSAGLNGGGAACGAPNLKEQQPGTVVARYRVLARATIRDGCERKGSCKVGAFELGDEVVALEKGANTRGQARVRCARGWVSLIAGDGTLLLDELPRESSGRGVVPDGEAELDRGELSADMTMWLLENPTGELSDWVSGSDWVCKLGAAEGNQWTATKCWPEAFDAARRDMQLLPAIDAAAKSDEGDDRLRTAAAIDLDDLRELGRQWALAPDILSLDDGTEEQGSLTAPAPTPASSVVIPEADDAPCTWSAAQAAIGSVAAPRTPPSAAASAVSSPQSFACNSFTGDAFGRVHTIEADDEWTSVDVITPVTATENGGLRFTFFVEDDSKVAGPPSADHEGGDGEAWELVQTE